ncbi:unnamed protein product [Aspergillus oryzae RIB40]|uniref:DNA, SC009 n=1 Tax=Aspergillus oryzae (strain ATCC 42149 / RIB 40) TaxID=510516 RepID=Q2UV85_ASPOR|nr:unnamed protein product [Aspergillus oryzae RIB40]BAE54527.1 unnamed protein product [Aspergillus oryzae RIB40]
MARRGRPPRYANRDERNAERRRRRREQGASQIPPPPEAQLHHRFLTWITTEEGDIHPDVVESRDIFQDLEQLVLDGGEFAEGAGDAEGEDDMDIDGDMGDVPDSDVEMGDVERVSRRSAEGTPHEDPSAAGSPSLSGPAGRFPNTAEAEGQPVSTQPTAETATHWSHGPRVASPAVPLPPEDSARQEVLAEHLVKQLIRHRGCGHSQEEPGPIPEDQAGPRSPPAVPTVRLSEVVQEEYPDVLSRDGIAAYRPAWDEYFPVDRRRRLFSGVETIHAEDGGPGELQGIQPERTPPPQLDLEQDSDTAGRTFQVHFDIDSAGGFASSLAVARQGLYWVGVRPPVSNLTGSLHLDGVPVQFQDGDSGRWRRDRRPVHRIPHLPLGRVCGFEAVEIYILFPRLYHPTRKSFVITKDEYTLWMDEVFLPALHATYSESILQNLPVSAADAQARATAASAEQPMEHDKRPRVQLLQYGLRPELLDSLWQGVCARIEGQGLAQFRGMKLLLTCKNLKSRTQGPSWAAAQARFFAIWSEAVDVDFLTDDFYDIGREAILPQSRPAGEAGPPATFLSWRRCCLEGFSHWLEEVAATVEGGALSTAPDPIGVTTGPSQRAVRPTTRQQARPQGPPVSDHESDGDVEYTPAEADREGTGAVGEGPRPAKVRRRWRQEMYPFSLTRAMATLTIEPTRRSGLRKLGYLYSQHYNSGKALFAAGNHYVFSNPALDTLALDEGLIRAWQHVGRAVSHSPMALLRAYRYTKHRCHMALADSGHRAYGVREEYRVSGGLLRAVDRRMWAQGLAGQELHVPQASADPSTDPAPPHLPFFCHRTDLMLRWLRWNINKFCLGFEMVYGLRPRTMVQWEHTRVMMMFLRCLLFAFGGQGAHPRRCNGLWLDRRVRPAADGSERERIDEGLGMEQALEQYGYAWLPDHKIDWASMTFRPPHRAHMSLNTPTLLAAYHSHYRAVLSTHSDFLLFHDVFARMYSLREDRPRSALLLQLLVDLCLRAFRKDVFAVLAERSGTTQPVHRRQMEAALAGEVPLTVLGLRRVFQRRPLGDDFRFVESRSAKVHHIEVLFAWLWGWQGDGNNGDCNRTHWEKKPYRTYMRQCFDTIAQVYGLRQAREWRTTLQRTFIRTHWVLPYPSDRSFWSRATGTPGGNRFQTWLSVHPGLVEYYRATEPTDPAVRQSVVITPQDVPYLPVSGWQRAQSPMPLDIALPPIPTDLDAYLAAVADPAGPDTDLDIPLPAIGVLDGPIQQYILDHTPEKRILRSYQREETTAVSSIHSDSKWLIAHLENQVRVLRDAYLQRQRDLSIPFWRRVDSESPQYLFTAPAKVLEEDSDSENIRNKRTRAEKKHCRYEKDLRDTHRLVQEFMDLRQEMKIIKKTIPGAVSPAESKQELVKKHKVVHERANQIRKKLVVISKRVIEEPVEL